MTTRGTTIGFLGTGLMGAAMVEGMLRRGHAVTVWNRTRERTGPLAALGARVADTPADAARRAERVHLMLSDDVAVDSVIERLRPGLAAGALVVDHSTVSPAGTVARFHACDHHGVELLHAPVFMGPQHCREASGLMLCAGPEARFARARPALESMTGSVWHLGERVDLAAAYKLFGNAMLFAIIGGLADVFQMARALGIEPADAQSLFARFKPGGAIDARGARMAQGDFAATFELTMARKDVRLMIEAAGGAPLAVLPGLARRFDAVIAEGRGRDDVGAIAAEAVRPARS